MNDDDQVARAAQYAAQYAVEVERFNATTAGYIQQAERFRRRRRAHLWLAIIFFVIGVVMLSYSFTHWPF